MFRFIEIIILGVLLLNISTNKGRTYNVLQRKIVFELPNDLQSMLQDREVLANKRVFYKVTQTLLEIVSYKTAVQLN